MENVARGVRYFRTKSISSMATRNSEPMSAEAELAKAERDLEKADRDVKEAERDIAKAIEEEKHPHQFEVTVFYNGVPKKFQVRRDELVQRLLDQARQAFGPINNPHLLGLFTKAGVELKDDQTIEAAGEAARRATAAPERRKGRRASAAYRLPRRILDETFALFRGCGRGRRECQVLWVSPWDAPETITKAVHPKHEAHFGGFVARRPLAERLLDHPRPGEIGASAFKCTRTRARRSTRRLTTPFLSFIRPAFFPSSFRISRGARWASRMPT